MLNREQAWVCSALVLGGSGVNSWLMIRTAYSCAHWHDAAMVALLADEQHTFKAVILSFVH